MISRFVKPVTTYRQMADNDFSKEETWKKMSKANGDTEWPLPTQKPIGYV